MNDHEPRPYPSELEAPEVLHTLDQPEVTPEIPLPTEGGIYEGNGIRYRFVRGEPIGEARDRETGEMEPVYPTLKNWFAHHVPGLTGGGPGWEFRQGLLGLSEEQMLRRYGHVFTPEEVRNPLGELGVDHETGDEIWVGGMPDTIPYYDLKKIENDAGLPTSLAQ